MRDAPGARSEERNRTRCDVGGDVPADPRDQPIGGSGVGDVPGLPTRERAAQLGGRERTDALACAADRHASRRTDRGRRCGVDPLDERHVDRPVGELLALHRERPPHCEDRQLEPERAARRPRAQRAGGEPLLRAVATGDAAQRELEALQHAVEQRPAAGQAGGDHEDRRHDREHPGVLERRLPALARSSVGATGAPGFEGHPGSVDASRVSAPHPNAQELRRITRRAARRDRPTWPVGRRRGDDDRPGSAYRVSARPRPPTSAHQVVSAGGTSDRRRGPGRRWSPDPRSSPPPSSDDAADGRSTSGPR